MDVEGVYLRSNPYSDDVTNEAPGTVSKLEPVSEMDQVGLHKRARASCR